ncbi:hypothetical protein ACQPXS_38540 [Streptomyces sp. CA-142005]|uniref:hypothetical protein n=1 Tax=Streptomyces sp. CA-142005 TaxID=3240052 RepID=UPI003D90275E
MSRTRVSRTGCLELPCRSPAGRPLLRPHLPPTATVTPPATPPPAAFRKLVDTGRLHYVLVPRADLRPGALAAARPVGALLRWTATHCALVPLAAYDPGDRIRLLYHCGPAHQG